MTVPVDFTDWITLMGRTDRACLDVSDDVDFFPNRGADTAPAKQVCAGCPVRQLCLEWAIRHELHGVWGGTSGKQRCAIRRHRGINVSLPGAVAAVGCGTDGGYHRHRRRGEPPCDPCHAAFNAAQRRRLRRRSV